MLITTGDKGDCNMATKPVVIKFFAPAIYDMINA